ncbi:MAG: glycosyltransferase [Chloroflexota bacterium]
MTVRVLVVARAYPSFDARGRGSFVADHVAALHEAGAEVVVASFETVQARGPQAAREAAADAAEAHWRPTLVDPAALTVGARFGAAGVAVARLPVVRTWGAMDGSEVPVMVARHRAPSVAFAEGLAAAGSRFDVVHAHNGLPDGAAAVAVASTLGVPLVVTEHDSTLADRLRDPSAAAAYRHLLAFATVVTVSQGLADRVSAALRTTSDETGDIHGVLANVVPLSQFAAPGPTDVRDLDELLWVGARAPHKGFETLLRAFAGVRARRPALHLRAIGPSTPDDEGRWQELIGELGIDGAVHLEPAAPREVVAAAMRRAGLFVHPSPFETFGMVAAEALASGLPVAATPSGGVQEILGAVADRGEVAAAPSPGALADAILRLRDRLQSIDRAALRESIEARYAPNVVAARTLALYEAARSRTEAAAPAAALSDGQSGGRRSQHRSPATPPPIVGAVVVGAHPTAAARVDSLPDGPLPVRHVRPAPTPANRTATRPRGLLSLLHGRRERSPSTTGPVEDAWRELSSGDASGRVVLVPADVEDVTPIASAFGGQGATHLAPGSLRWLGDLRDASAARVGR